MNRLQRLHEAGVSIWLDTLSRELLESGEFSELVRDYAVTGATSNPTIFARAITGSARYDEQLRSLALGAAPDIRELFFAIALDDVRSAAAILRPVHERTGGGELRSILARQLGRYRQERHVEAATGLHGELLHG